MVLDTVSVAVKVGEMLADLKKIGYRSFKKAPGLRFTGQGAAQENLRNIRPCFQNRILDKGLRHNGN